jgi:hypothetical protein
MDNGLTNAAIPASDTPADYTDPVARLLTFGEPVDGGPEGWPDVVSRFGFGAGDVDELIRMACDPVLNLTETDGDGIWAPVHAMRALGQLRAEAAVAPLLALSATKAGEFMPDHGLSQVFGMIGPAAIGPVAGFLLDPATPTFPAAAAAESLREIARRHPSYRAECIEILERRLRSPAPMDATINGFVVSALLDLAAVGSIEVIADAFRRDVIDLSIAGDLEDVEIELGLRERRTTAKPRYVTVPDDRRPSLPTPPPPVRREKVGRNDPCPCGSGKKYKKCCLR